MQLGAVKNGRRRLARRGGAPHDVTVGLAMREHPPEAIFRSRPDTLRWIVGALVVVSLSRIHYHFPALKAASPGLLLTLAAVGYGLLRPDLLSLGRLFEPWPSKVLVGLGAVACVTAPFGLSLGGSADFFLSNYGKVLFTALLVVATIRHAGDLRFYIHALVLSAGILVAQALFVFEPSTASSGVVRLSNLYTYDANDLGCVLVTLLPLCVLLYEVSDGWRRWGVLAVLMGIGVTSAVSGSRGAFVGLAAVMLALVLTVRHLSLVKRVGVVAAVATGLVVWAPAGYWTQMETLSTPTEDYNWVHPYGRKAMTERGIGYMLDRPLTGLGINNFRRAEVTISERARNVQDFPGMDIKLSYMTPHNSWIEVGSELGIAGLLLWGSLVIGGILGGWKIRRRLGPTWRNGDSEQRLLYATATYLPVSLLGFGVTSSFVSFAYLDLLYLVSALTAGLYLTLGHRLRRERITLLRATAAAPPSPPSRPTVGAGAASRA